MSDNDSPQPIKKRLTVYGNSTEHFDYPPPARDNDLFDSPEDLIAVMYDSDPEAADALVKLARTARLFGFA